MQQEVINLNRRIDALEHVIAMVNVNLTTLEAAVDNAEAELGVSDRLFAMLNRLPFFVSYTCFHDVHKKISKVVLYFRKRPKNLRYQINYQCTNLRQFIKPTIILKMNERTKYFILRKNNRFIDYFHTSMYANY